MTNYPKLSAENNSAIGAAFDAWTRQNDPRTYPAERQAFEAGWAAAQQGAVPADEWLRQMDALVDAHDEERKTGTAAGRVKARVAIKAHARRRVDLAAQQDASAAQAVPADVPKGEPMTLADVERQYKDGVHIASGLPRESCPCGLCKKYPAQADAPKGEPSDEDIEATVKELGMRWNGDHWICEDADLHPVVRALLARYTAPAQPKGEPVGHAMESPVDPAYTIATFNADKVPAGAKLYAAPLDAAAIRNAAIEDAKRLLLNGRFLHDAAPPALFAREAAAALDALKTDHQETGE